MKKLFILFIILFLSFDCFAASTITGVSGTISQGESIVIAASGGGFGTGDSTPICFDDFEAYSDGASLSSSPLVGAWSLLAATTTVEDTTAHSGVMSTYHSGDSDQANFLVALAGQTNDNIYISYWYNYNYTGDSSVVKVIQLHGNNSDCDYWPGIMWSTGPGASGYVVYTSCTNTNFTNVYASNPQNQWNYIELILTQSTNGTADGHVEIRINGTVIHNSDAIRTRNSGYWNQFYYFYSVSNSDTSTIQLDDVYGNNSWARVVIGASETYTDNTSFEICPASSWADGSITVRGNVGNLAADSTAYVFVIDADGVISDNGAGDGAQGYEITIGGESSSTANITGLKSMNGGTLQ